MGRAASRIRGLSPSELKQALRKDHRKFIPQRYASHPKLDGGLVVPLAGAFSTILHTGAHQNRKPTVMGTYAIGMDALETRTRL
jgi:hypothetical protein